MIFADLRRGDRVFVDSNTLIYHFSGHPQFGGACTALLQRIAQRDIEGFVSTPVLTEVAHRLMLLEASIQFGWPHEGALRRLKRQPAFLQQLTGFRQSIEHVLQIGCQVISITAAQVLAAADISRQTGLFSNDALIIAVMQEHGLSNLDSHDADFDRVPGLVRYAPA